MTIDYRNRIVPIDPAFSPPLDRIRALIERLRRDRWVLSASDVKRVAKEDGIEVRPWMVTGGRAELYLPGVSDLRRRRADALPIPLDLDTAWLARLVDDAVSPQAAELSLHFDVSSGCDSWSALGWPYPFTTGADEDGAHEIQIFRSRDYIATLESSGEMGCACGAELGYKVDRQSLAPIDEEARIASTCPACAAAYDPTKPPFGAVFRFAVVVDCDTNWPRPEDSQEQAWRAAALRSAGYDVQDMFGREIPEFKRPVHDPKNFVYRSPAGDPAPVVAPAFLKMVEEEIGMPVEAVPEFY